MRTLLLVSTLSFQALGVFLSALTRVKMTDIGVFPNPPVRMSTWIGLVETNRSKDKEGEKMNEAQVSHGSTLQTKLSVDPNIGRVEMLSAGTASEITIRPL